MTGRRCLLAALACAGLGLGCSQSPTLVSSHDFDRPTDMVFGCMGLYPVSAGTLRPTGLPMSVCHPPDKREPDPLVANIARRTYGFVTNSARGELSVIDMDLSRLVDLDLAVAGFNPAPLGQLPEALAISDDGCRLVTANRGSCDLTVVNPGLMMSSAAVRIAPADAGAPEPQPDPVSQTVVVRTGSGKRLMVAPYEVQFLPQDTEQLTKDVASATVPFCQKTPLVSAKGWNEDSRTTGWKALITFPACDLVALVNLPSGDIVDSVKINVQTIDNKQKVAVEHTGTEPTCPVECGAAGPTVPVPTSDAGSATDGDETAINDAAADQAVSDSARQHAAEVEPDAVETGDDDSGIDATDTVETGDAPGSVDGGAPPQLTLDNGVGPLAVRPEGKRAFVGLANAPLVAAIDIEPDTGLLTPVANNTGIELHEGAVGSARLRLSVDPYSDRPFLGRGALQDREYLYVIARDGTVRVVHVKADQPLQECDTNVDPSLLAGNDPMRAEPCIPVNGESMKRRRPLANGPGLPVQGARDVAVVEIRPPSFMTTQPTTTDFLIDGVFAMVLTDSGTNYLVNIYPVARSLTGIVDGVAGQKIPEPEPLANSLRDRNFIPYATTLDAVSGPPRLDLDPVLPSFGPRLEGIYAKDTADNALVTGATRKTYVFFPDRGAVTPQTWGLTWEGDLVSLRFTGRIDSTVTPDHGPDFLPPMDFTFADPGGGFCDADVQPGDVVTLLGCTDGAQCGSGQVCLRSPSAPQSAGGLPINGLCLNAAPASQDLLVKTTCRRLLESVRRYSVTRASGGALDLRPNLDELVAPTEDPNACMDGDEGKHCGPPDDVDSSHAKFVCHLLPTDNKGNSDEGNNHNKLHCVNPCGEGADQGDADCRVGRKCVDFGAAHGGRMCADAPAQPDLWRDCFPQLTAYRVQAGHSFLVQGSATGISLPPVFVPGTNVCAVRQPSSSARVVRIPMTAPRCAEAKFPEGLRDRAVLEKLNTALDPEDKDPSKRGTYLPLALVKQRPRVDDDKPNANPCLFVAGPNEGDDTATMNAASQPTASADAGTRPETGDGGGVEGGVAQPRKLLPGIHVRALFRNPEFQFILSNLEQQFTDVYLMRFEVHGGFLPEVVAPSSAVEIGLPRRLLISPLASPGTQDAKGNLLWDGPQYLFVVDQRRLGRNRVAGGATRGQVLRINLQRYNIVDLARPAITYDDFNSSGGLYPIQ